MDEPIPVQRLRIFGQELGADRLIDRLDYRRFLGISGKRQNRYVELSTRNRRQLQELPGCARQAGDPQPDRHLDRVRHLQLDEGPQASLGRLEQAERFGQVPGKLGVPRSAETACPSVRPLAGRPA
jgi:hypothetical protein